MIYRESEGRFVASSRGVWIPGCYESERAARYAFQFSDGILELLQRAVVERDGCGIITFADLQDVAAKRKKACAS